MLLEDLGHECVGLRCWGQVERSSRIYRFMRNALRLQRHRSDQLCHVLPKRIWLLWAEQLGWVRADGEFGVWDFPLSQNSQEQSEPWSCGMVYIYIYRERERVCICTYTYMKAIFHGFGVCFFLTISLQTEFWGFQGTWGVMKETATEYIRENFLNVRSMKMHYSLQTRTLHCLQC